MHGTMGRCELIKYSGIKCGSTYRLNQIFLNDGHAGYQGMITICQIDSQEVFGKLRRKENETKSQIDKIQKDVNKLQESSWHNNEIKSLLQERREKLSNLGKILQEFRNHYCRMCAHTLTCICEQCKNRHSGTVISSATLFSINGYRRDTFNFHIICGRIFFNMFGIKLMPQSSGQETLV